MKHLIFLLLLSSTLHAQNYEDSLITLQYKQRTAWWVATAIKNGGQVWENRNMPATLKPFTGSGTRPDSMFTVTIQAKFLRGGLELLLTQPLLLAIDDYNSIIKGLPFVTGYTSLETQIVNMANGNGPQKQTAIWLRDWYIERVKNFTDLYNEQKAAIINW